MCSCHIAIVASIETLLCIEASDRMDVDKRYISTNTELKAGFWKYFIWIAWRPTHDVSSGRDNSQY
ncbi:MAG: hypothetical protein IPG18_08585 [Saprospiraceae bacterium]|nr:hypothetical protein [Saprospiraceae bacterium]